MSPLVDALLWAARALTLLTAIGGALALILAAAIITFIVGILRRATT